jgi:predicted DNA-binding transcriptional regulator
VSALVVGVALLVKGLVAAQDIQELYFGLVLAPHHPELVLVEGLVAAQDIKELYFGLVLAPHHPELVLDLVMA